MKKVENLKLSSQTKEGDCCPECNANWDGGDIYEHFLEAKFNPNHKQHDYYGEKTLAEIKETAGHYGWTEETPKRFGNLIGIDMSMVLNANEDEQYDGVSYWQCPKCQVAWDSFSGKRTDKFVKSEKETEFTIKEPVSYTGTIEPIIEEEDKQIIYNAIKTPDGTVISSDHGHDYVMHKDKNGKTYGVDGGHNYLRRIGDCSDCEDLSMYLEPWTPEFHEKARKVVKRGGRGKDGRQPLTWVPICEMNDNWVKVTIEYNSDRGFTIENSWFTNLLHEEMHYRNANSITIEEVE